MGYYHNPYMIDQPYSSYDMPIIDYVKLTGLGFNERTISTLERLLKDGVTIRASNLVNRFGMSYGVAQELKYLYDVVIGKVSITTTEELVSHLKKLHGKNLKISMSDMVLSNVREVPQVAVVAGINDETYKIYNSANNPPDQRLYRVADVTSTRIVVLTKKRPVLRLNQSMKIDGVVEILNESQNGKYLKVAFNKKYCKLCNRFVIAAGFRKPMFHHGLAEIVCLEGTRVYVFAKSIGTKSITNSNQYTQRIYDYGFSGRDIKKKLFQVARNVYDSVYGVVVTLEEKNQDYIIIEREKQYNDRDEFDDD